MKFSGYRIFFGMFLIFLFFDFSYGAVRAFSEYDTDMVLHANGSIDVHKKISLRNIHEVGIVPGDIEFKVSGGDNDIEVTDFRAIDRYGRDIRSKLVETANYTAISLEIFSPLLPGFEYKIDLYYTVVFEPEGLLFKRLEVPLRENTMIPIWDGETRLTLPDNYHLTYLEFEDNNTLIEGKTITWPLDGETPHKVAFEYSYLPINVGGVQGSYVFWASVNLILIIILVVEIRREIKNFKASDK